MCIMYFGSVRFFKHLIVAFIILLICGLVISILCLTVKNKSFEDQLSNIRDGAALAQSNGIHGGNQGCLSIDYQELYPDLYVKPSKKEIKEPNTLYLTFDDGPSGRTAEILDILKQQDIKATFFIVGKEGSKEKDLMKRIVDEGHTIGVHTYSHIYTNIYESVGSYLEDFNLTSELIYATTGVKPDIFRFPGGSINKYSALNYEEIIAEMTRRGYAYYDWNASSGDANSNATANSVYNNATQSSGGKERIILLMHDSASKSYTVAALPGIIEYYKTRGYKFDRITNDVSPISFNYINY